MRKLVRFTLALSIASTGLACGDSDAPEAGPTCAEAVGEAALEIETDRQLRGLDEALSRCASYDEYLTQLRAHPGVVGYSPETYIELRCNAVTDPAARGSATCRTVAPPSTPPPSAAQVVYAAETLDGRVVELRPSQSVPFVAEVPAVIQETVDLANSQGCPGVLAQRDTYLALAPTDDIASVYAQHAINVALWIGCDGVQPAVSATAPG